MDLIMVRFGAFGSATLITLVIIHSSKIRWLRRTARHIQGTPDWRRFWAFIGTQTIFTSAVWTLTATFWPYWVSLLCVILTGLGSYTLCVRLWLPFASFRVYAPLANYEAAHQHALSVLRGESLKRSCVTTIAREKKATQA